MKLWPIYAGLAIQRVRKEFKDHEHQAQILDRISENELELKPLFNKVDAIFLETIRTPGAIKTGNDAEPEEIIHQRFWLIFFQTFIYAANRHYPVKEIHLTEGLNQYHLVLEKSIKRAEELTECFALIQQHRNKLPINSEVASSLTNNWLSNGLEYENNAFCNPVYDALEEIRHRFERHWPNPESILHSITESLKDDYFHETQAERYSKAKGLLNTLIKECNWCRETSSDWHLPSIFIKGLSGESLANLISIAWGKVENNKDKDLSRQGINKAIREVLAKTDPMETF